MVVEAGNLSAKGDAGSSVGGKGPPKPAAAADVADAAAVAVAAVAVAASHYIHLRRKQILLAAPPERFHILGAESHIRLA